MKFQQCRALFRGSEYNFIIIMSCDCDNNKEIRNKLDIYLLSQLTMNDDNNLLLI